MEVSAPQIPTPKPRRGTLAVGPFPPGLRLRGYHPLRRDFPDHFGFAGEGAADPQQPHIPDGFPHRVRFGLSPFRSPLLRGSQLVSFPPPTWMLPFGGFPLPHPPRSHEELPEGYGSAHAERGREVPFGHPRIYGCMRLPGAYRSLPRPSSAPEPSYPPGGLVCRVSVKPFTFNFQTLHGIIANHERFASPSPPRKVLGSCIRDLQYKQDFC